MNSLSSQSGPDTKSNRSLVASVVIVGVFVLYVGAPILIAAPLFWMDRKQPAGPAHDLIEVYAKPLNLLEQSIPAYGEYLRWQYTALYRLGLMPR